MAERQGTLSFAVLMSGQQHRMRSASLFQPAIMWILLSGTVFLCLCSFTGILRCTVPQEKEINKAIIYPVLSLSPVRMNKEKENWFHTARNLYAKTSVRTVTLRPAQAEYLMTGKILPAELFSIPLLPW